MCGTDYENILNTHKKVDNKKDILKICIGRKNLQKQWKGLVDIFWSLVAT
jgi:hypothetical protein